MELTEISNDCLEKVFRYLSLGDLLNVADSNKQLRAAAELTYFYKYGKKKICVNYGVILINNKREPDIEMKDDIEINDWKRSYQILRCFGHLISKLEFNMILIMFCLSIKSEKFRDSFQHVINYVNEYCADSLTELDAYGLVDGILDHLQKPFQLVENLHIGGNFKKNLLTNLFPKVRSLVFCYTWCPDLMSIDSHFPCLESMDLCHYFAEDPIEIDKASKHYARIYSFLHLNPQLQSLELPHHWREKLPSNDQRVRSESPKTLIKRQIWIPSR